MNADELRLLALHRVIDGMGAIDLHDRACELAQGFEPKDEHYLAATREALDVVVKEEFGNVKPACAEADRSSVIKECREAVLEVLNGADEAAKAKDVVEKYRVGYIDAAVDCDEALYHLLNACSTSARSSKEE